MSFGPTVSFIWHLNLNIEWKCGFGFWVVGGFGIRVVSMDVTVITWRSLSRPKLEKTAASSSVIKKKYLGNLGVG